MSLAERLPGMEPGKKHRNYFVGAVYVIAFLALLGAISPDDTADAPEVDNGDSTPAETATPEPTDTQTQSDEDVGLEAARSGADGQFTERIRSVKKAPDFQGRDGYMAEVRVDLDTDMITGGDRAEHMGGTIAKRTIQSIEESSAQNVTAVAVYAYVPTNDGESVSTKVVADMAEYRGTDWSAYPWQNLRDDADQYTFNGYLYD